MSLPLCRSCETPLKTTFVDLGQMPVANAYPRDVEEAQREPRFSLHARVCDTCFLVQIEDAVTPEDLFRDYAYFSSFSDSWVDAAARFAADSVRRHGLNRETLVVEIASNDGYLLQHFKAMDIPVLGIEPAANVAEVAIARGLPTEVRFFGTETAEHLVKAGTKAQLLVANNVLAHVPDLNDFVEGIRTLLEADGAFSIEFPHLLRLIEEVQFDTIYHEHFSYFSLLAVERVLGRHGLRVTDVEELPTHGGSLRIIGGHVEHGTAPSPELEHVRTQESTARLGHLDTYMDFGHQVDRRCDALKTFLKEAKVQGRRVVAYGAAAKGTTLLNHCGVTPAHIESVLDRNPYKQGRLMPGSHIPIGPPGLVRDLKPDYLLILPWNIKKEVIAQMAFIREWGGRFVVPLPEVEVIA